MLNVNASKAALRSRFCDRTCSRGFYAVSITVLLWAVTGGTMIQQAEAGCKMPSSDAGIAYFVRKPERLLTQDAGTGQELAYRVRAYASFNHASLMAVARILTLGTEEQKKAIGEGLAMAVVACLPRDGETAREIADVVRRSSDESVWQGYMLVASADDPPRKPVASDEGRTSSGVGLDGAIGAKP